MEIFRISFIEMVILHKWLWIPEISQQKFLNSQTAICFNFLKYWHWRPHLKIIDAVIIKRGYRHPIHSRWLKLGTTCIATCFFRSWNICIQKKKETVQKSQSVLRIHVEPLNRSDQDGHKLSNKQKIPLNDKKLNPLWELWYWNKKPNSRNQESNAQTQAKQYMYIIFS